jgi:hypothetical protein
MTRINNALFPKSQRDRLFPKNAIIEDTAEFKGRWYAIPAAIFAEAQAHFDALIKRLSEKDIELAALIKRLSTKDLEITKLKEKLDRWQEGLTILSGGEDRRGYTHGSSLCGLGEMQTYARLILEGKEP